MQGCLSPPEERGRDLAVVSAKGYDHGRIWRQSDVDRRARLVDATGFGAPRLHLRGSEQRRKLGGVGRGRGAELLPLGAWIDRLVVNHVERRLGRQVAID